MARLSEFLREHRVREAREAYDEDRFRADGGGRVNRLFVDSTGLLPRA